MGKVLELPKPEPRDGYLVYPFPQWGAAVWSITQARWVTLVIATPGGEPQEIDVEHINVGLHENGVEFMGGNQ